MKKILFGGNYGRIEETGGKFVDYIKKDGKYSELSYEVVGYKNVDDKELTCVRIQLKTGRQKVVRKWGKMFKNIKKYLKKIRMCATLALLIK